MVYVRKSLFVRLVAVAVVALVVSASVPRASVSLVGAEDVIEPIPIDERTKMLQLALIALTFSDIPLDKVERYELFNTLYIYRNGSKVLVNEPYIPGDEVLNVTYAAKEVRDKIQSREIQYITEGNVTTVLWNGTEVMRIEVVDGDEGWTVYTEPVYNRTLDSNTVMYWRKVYANLSGYIAEYILVNLIRNVSQTHRIYIATVAEKQGDRYLYAFTYTNYWFKNKTTFFGDWIILPEGAPTLADYYKMIADGVKWLSTNIYKGSSPGYVPTSYPQIAKALNDLANNIPKEINLEVEKGYALVTDVVWKLVIAGVIGGAIRGAILYTIRWTVTTGGDISKWDWKEFAANVAAHAVVGALEGAYAPGSLAVKLGLKVMDAFAKLIGWIASRI